MTADSSLLGLSGRITAEQASRLIHDLSAAWEAVFGTPVGELEDDLETARRWFDPVAQGQRLRREIARLAPMPQRISKLKPPMVLSVGQDRYLVTPEGRCALDLLKHLPEDQAVHYVTASQIAIYERRLAYLYRDWSRHRLTSVVALLEGATKPLQIPAAGIVIALLVNRSTSEKRALVRFTSDPERSAVDKTFFAPVQAFADVLSPSRRRSDISAQLISGWMLYEARRRIGDAIVLDDGGDDRNGSVWIRSEKETAVIDTVARDLVRGHRTRVVPDLFVEGFDRLVVELRQASRALAGFGIAHERPRETQKLRELFVDRLSHFVATTP
ncbi:MAG: hypothetical protein OXI97_18430 [Acidimicrobiaceae bacterium]|nr:hypothetical protein [Acidimicrobiaceae bacterium]